MNDLTRDDIFKFTDLYFSRRFIMYNHLHNSFNKFLDEDVKIFLEKGENIFDEHLMANGNIVKYRFQMENVSIRPPVMDNDELMFPSDARNRNLTYESKIVADVTQIQEITNVISGEITTKKIGEKERNVPIANVPIMVRSKYCSLNLKGGYDNDECDYDPGGYFIVKGAEKVVISQDRMCENKPLCFIKKDSGVSTYVIQVNSKSFKSNGLIQIVSIRMKKENVINIKVPILNEIPVLILFRALGIETDRDIVRLIVYDPTDIVMINSVRVALNNSMTQEGTKIQTTEDALNYLTTKLRVHKKYTETDLDVKQRQKIMHLKYLLENNFLPHISGGLITKAYYLGYMINRLLKCFLGRTPTDDRDSYINKRVEGVGPLFEELFKQEHRKMLNECNKYFKKKNPSDENPYVVINQIKPTIIEQGLKKALAQGFWGKKKGVAQMLQRLSSPQTLSFLRRIDAQVGDASTSKLINPRQLHPSSLGFLCCVTGDSNILMSDLSFRKIKSLKDGDEVMSVDPTMLCCVPTKIKNWFKTTPTKLLKITTENGNEIKCTPDHPILVDTTDSMVDQYEFLDACNLKKKDLIFNLLGDDISYDRIINIKEIEPEEVYDFETEKYTHSFICNNIVVSNCVETPEHAKVGLVKHLSLIGNVTVISATQTTLIKEFLSEQIIKLNDVDITQIRNMYKVFLNGDWLGMIEKSFELVSELRKRKLEGIFDNTISIVFDIAMKEIRVYCDCGRLYRPVMKIENNVTKLTKELINKISLDKTKKGMITSWDEFLLNNTDVIEYIDMEEQPYLMIAQTLKDVEDMRIKMTESINKKVEETVLNRYDDNMFIRFTHCEFHSSLLVGLLTTNIPFCNYNQGTRDIFQYAQGKQAVSIYATNYRHRLDNSFLLYHPHRALVSTYTSKYTYTDVLPPGENIIIAIACYTGYNQEDSIVINKSAIDRGLFRSATLRKFISIIAKNQSTSQDDVFAKPDPSKVIGMKSGSYEKLNSNGYVPEESTLVTGDIIIGKIKPIPPTEGSSKIYKDNSEVYRMAAPAVVDRVYTGIFNDEGYEMRKASVRSERTPMIGDKVTNRHGQKSTIGLGCSQSDMMFSAKGITPDIIFTPNAIPSRLTVGMLLECLVGKLGATIGLEMDGTSFENVDVKDIQSKLEKEGKDKDGLEEMYNGMTGEKLKVKIFVCPCFYLRLKHLVFDKAHQRSHGPRTILTRQPPEGRARDGGLRLGEMERDCLIAHGLSYFLKEKFMDCSDAYVTYVCDVCGLFARHVLRNTKKGMPTELYYCPACNNKTKISKIMIPYAFKLLLQELMAMCIAPRIRVNKLTGKL